MKQIPELIQTLKVKIREHEMEIEATVVVQEDLSKQISELKEKGKAQESFMAMNKAMVLKDKIVFHKAAILTLTDVLESISV